MKKSFSAKRNAGRRAFLLGVGGATLGLPLLEFTHERAWAATGPLKRLVVVLTHGGEAMNIDQVSGAHRDGKGYGPKLDDWLPKAGWTFGEAMEPIRATGNATVGAGDKNLQNKLLVLRGVDNLAGLALDYGGDHFAGPGAALTQAKAIKPDGEHADLFGPSIDAVAASGLAGLVGGRATPVYLAVHGFMYKTGFFSGTLGSKASPQEGESDPARTWQALFAGVTSTDTGPDAEAVRAAEHKASILNSLMDGYRAFRGQLGTSDQRIVEAHLDHLTDLEKQIQIASSVTSCTVPGKPSADPDWGNP
ncbi:MAG: DUF1552 domain-containing protein, partial [Myxococcales bacterium]|nr:DUF1552 domain-containing protein [Myxococcales bacterium]